MTTLELACGIFAWLITRPAITNGADIPRPPAVIAAIANAIAYECIERNNAFACDWAHMGAVLDVWGAFETGYTDIGGGCNGVENGTPCPKAHAATCGPWMTDCHRKRRSNDLDGEAALALDMMLESFNECGEAARKKNDEVIAYGLYAGGACDAFGVVRFRLRWVAKEIDK